MRLEDLMERAAQYDENLARDMKTMRIPMLLPMRADAAMLLFPQV